MMPRGGGALDPAQTAGDSAPRAKDSSLARIMVVEDAPEFQELVVLTLTLEPHLKVDFIASSGEEALDAFDRVSPDLVLLDFRLPGIDGLETARRMKQQRPDVKIALVTAYTEDVLKRAAHNAHVEAVIPKADFSLTRVLEVLDSTSSA